MINRKDMTASSGRPATLLPAVSLSNPLLGLGAAIRFDSAHHRLRKKARN
jgi:hypothetical protein